MSEALARWNRLSVAEAQNAILPCCGSRAWAERLAQRRPLASEAELLSAADEIWRGLSEADWMEAFHSHPRIGESLAQQPMAARSAVYSAQEQKSVAAGDDGVKIALAEANREYERRFGHIFIVCATGRSADEILKILQSRLQNDGPAELHEAAEQQRQITRIRLKRWLAEGR